MAKSVAAITGDCMKSILLLKRRWRLLLIAALVSFPALGASAATTTCDSCSDASILANVQLVLDSAPLPSEQILYVVDRVVGETRKFYLVNSYLNEGGDPKICSAPMDSTPLECVPF